MRKSLLAVVILSVTTMLFTSLPARADGGLSASVGTFVTIWKTGKWFIDKIKGYEHSWYYCDYSSGHRVYNRIRNMRSLEEVRNYFSYNGDNHSWYIDNDWGAVHVCLSREGTYGSDRSWLGECEEVVQIDHPPAGYWLKVNRPTYCGQAPPSKQESEEFHHRND